MISIVNQVINHFLQSTENQQYNYFNVILKALRINNITISMLFLSPEHKVTYKGNYIL